MKIWVDGNWYTLPHKLLIIYLTEQDKKNIANMNKDCSLYCHFDEKIYDIDGVKELLRKLKKEATT